LFDISANIAKKLTSFGMSRTFLENKFQDMGGSGLRCGDRKVSHYLTHAQTESNVGKRDEPVRGRLPSSRWDSRESQAIVNGHSGVYWRTSSGKRLLVAVSWADGAQYPAGQTKTNGHNQNQHRAQTEDYSLQEIEDKTRRHHCSSMKPLSAWKKLL
jgi:hypothetical protein